MQGTPAEWLDLCADIVAIVYNPFHRNKISIKAGRRARTDKTRYRRQTRPGKPGKDRTQLSFLEGDKSEYFYFVNNTEKAQKKRCNLEEIVLVLSEFRHSHNSSGVK